MHRITDSLLTFLAFQLVGGEFRLLSREDLAVVATLIHKGELEQASHVLSEAHQHSELDSVMFLKMLLTGIISLYERHYFEADLCCSAARQLIAEDNPRPCFLIFRALVS